jgi:cyclophilin family peptidyl-prolyl cis-trans isomerase
MQPKTVKSFIKLCERISITDRDKLKGIKSKKQYDLIGFIRASVQNELKELSS